MENVYARKHHASQQFGLVVDGYMNELSGFAMSWFVVASCCVKSRLAIEPKAGSGGFPAATLQC